MKERLGWSPQINPDFTSGLKNQAPFIEPGTEFEGGDYICAGSNRKDFEVQFYLRLIVSKSS